MKKILITILFGYSIINRNYNEICHYLANNFSFNCSFNLFLITGIISIKFLLWCVFGDLSPGEIKIIADEFNYTTFEYFIGNLLLWKSIKFNKFIFLKNLVLFVCLMLLKGFHHLIDLKVVKLKLESNDRRISFKIISSLLLVFLIDTILILKFKNEFNNNYLFKIFGYELLNLYPMIVISILNLILKFNYNNKLFLIKYKLIFEFSLNLIRLFLFGIYLWCFDSIIPLHILPSSYYCFRLVLKNLKNLIIFQKEFNSFNYYFNNLKKGDADFINCVICLEFKDLNQDIRILKCDHKFHFECISSWLVKSETCPICRQALNQEPAAPSLQPHPTT